MSGGPGKAPSASRVEMTELVMPGQTNSPGFLFGGVGLAWMDVAAGVAAMRHANGPAVTASIDRVDFLQPIRLGDIVVLRAQVNFAARTSMEVGVRVETEDPRTGERRYTTKAYLTFVAVAPDGTPRPVPAIEPQTDEERRRYQAAEARRAARLATRKKT
jgi:acyl-CoA hydrolase